MSAAVSISQWTEPPGSSAATMATPGYLVENPDGSYSFSDTGPADAYLVPDAEGAHVIDPLASSGARLRVFGNTLLLL